MIAIWLIFFKWMLNHNLSWEMMVPLEWYPSCLTPEGALLNAGIPNKYTLYKVSMGWRRWRRRPNCCFLWQLAMFEWAGLPPGEVREGTTTGATEPPLGGNWEDICKAGTCHYQIGWRTKVQDLLWCSSGMQALTTSNQLKSKRRKEGRKGYHLYLKIQPQMLVKACLRINIFFGCHQFLWETPRNRWGKPEKAFAVFLKNLEKMLLLLSIDPYNSFRLYEILLKAKALEDNDPNLIPMTDPWDDYIGRS